MERKRLLNNFNLNMENWTLFIIAKPVRKNEASTTTCSAWNYFHSSCLPLHSLLLSQTHTRVCIELNLLSYKFNLVFNSYANFHQIFNHQKNSTLDIILKLIRAHKLIISFNDFFVYRHVEYECCVFSYLEKTLQYAILQFIGGIQVWLIQ